MSKNSGYPPPGMFVKKNEPSYNVDENNYDYVKRLYRGHRSKTLKKMYARTFRRKNKINNYKDYEEFSEEHYKGNDYRRLSGDFWWDLT